MKQYLLLFLLLIGANAVYSQADDEDDDNDQIANCHIDLPSSFEPNVELGRIMEVEIRDVHSFDVKIFDKWGKKVLESIIEIEDSDKHNKQKIKLMENGMDDVHYNSELKTGDYEFSIDAVCNDGSFLRHYGTIRLIWTQHK